MAAPFTTLDGADKDGVRAEVHVQKGTGVIIDIEKKDDEGATNAYIVIKSSLAQVKKPVKGWLAKSDPLYAVALAALESSREIEYRLESQRKRGVDRTIPIAELRPNMEVAAQNTIMIVAGLDGELSKEAVTDPAEDPAEGGRIPATRQNNGPRQAAAPAPTAAAGPALDKDAALTALATARATGMDEGVINAAAAFALMTGATAKQVKEAGFTAQRASNRGEVRRAFASEAAPHIAANSDGRTNLGSWQVGAAFSARRFARDLLAEAAQRSFDEYNAAVEAGEIDGEKMDAPAAINPAQVLAITKILLELADRVQVGAYGGGRPDRMANSHTRARTLVFDSIRSRNPIPFRTEEVTAEEHAERTAAWRATVIEESIEEFRALVETSLEIAEDLAADPEAATQADEQAPAAATQADGPTAPVTPIEQAASSRAQQAERRRVPVEGDEDFQAPDQDVMQRFGALASAAGFESKPGSPVQVYLMAKFGVNLARKVHGPALAKQVTWFETNGGGAKFRELVEKEVAAQPKSA